MNISPEMFIAQTYPSKGLWGLNFGPARITGYVNGIPSASRMVNAGVMLVRLYLPALMK